MKQRIMASLAALVLGLSGGLAAVLASPAGPAQAAANYFYIKANDPTTTDGYSADLSIDSPYLNLTDRLPAETHTLMAMSASDSTVDNGVEVGWIKGNAWSDTIPSLFSFPLIDGVNTSGWEGDPVSHGFVDNGSNSRNLTSSLSALVGTSHTFATRHTSNGWEVYFDGTSVGWWPDSLWTAQSISFTQAGRGQAYGEVASDPTGVVSTPCTDMGNGSGTATVSNWKRWDSGTSAWVAGTLATPVKSPAGIPAGVYDFSSASATGFTLGGPGWNSITSGPGNGPGAGAHCAPNAVGTPNDTLILWGQICPDSNGAGTGCTNQYHTAASCSPAPCLISGALSGTMYRTWQNTSTSGKSFTVGRTAACTGTQLTLAPNGSGTAKGILPAGWEDFNIKCIRRIA